MNIIDFQMGTSEVKAYQEDNTLMSFQHMTEKLMFLFGQLEPRFIEPIIFNIEKIFGTDSDTLDELEGNDIEDVSRSDFIGRAVTRFLYAISGQSFEDTAFAFTCVQIRALQLGADDCDDLKMYS